MCDAPKVGDRVYHQEVQKLKKEVCEKVETWEKVWGYVA
jgi:hypothetical protein